MPSRPQKPVVVRMDARLHAALKRRAAKEERSMAQLMRFALWEYVGGKSK